MSGANIIPTLRYRNAPAAIEWLCRAFGFDRHMVVDGPDGTVVHAQLTYGDGMIMLGSSRDDEFGRLMKTPREAETNTQSTYIVVEQINSHHERAVASGAEIVMPLVDEDYGGKGYSALDLEGNLWNFGSYNPWSSEGSR